MSLNANGATPLHHHDVATSRLRTLVVEAGPADATRGVRDFSDDLAAFLDESDLVGRGPVHLLRWSLGGGVVLQYATEHPERVVSITLNAMLAVDLGDA